MAQGRRWRAPELTPARRGCFRAPCGRDRDHPTAQARRPWPFDGRRLLIGDRLPGQTSWSKALVRHGADPRPALAWVLGVSGDIRVKDRPSREPLAAATCEGDCLRWKIILPSRLEQFGFILGSETRCWRKPDSNHWFRVTRPSFRRRLITSA